MRMSEKIRNLPTIKECVLLCTYNNYNNYTWRKQRFIGGWWWHFDYFERFLPILLRLEAILFPIARQNLFAWISELSIRFLRILHFHNYIRSQFAYLLRLTFAYSTKSSKMAHILKSNSGQNSIFSPSNFFDKETQIFFHNKMKLREKNRILGMNTHFVRETLYWVFFLYLCDENKVKQNIFEYFHESKQTEIGLSEMFILIQMCFILW